MTLHDVQHASSLLVHRWVDSSPILASAEPAKLAQTEGVCSHVVGFCEDGS